MKHTVRNNNLNSDQTTRSTPDLSIVSKDPSYFNSWKEDFLGTAYIRNKLLKMYMYLFNDFLNDP